MKIDETGNSDRKAGIGDHGQFKWLRTLPCWQNNVQLRAQIVYQEIAYKNIA